MVQAHSNQPRTSIGAPDIYELFGYDSEQPHVTFNLMNAVLQSNPPATMVLANEQKLLSSVHKMLTEVDEHYRRETVLNLDKQSSRYHHGTSDLELTPTQAKHLIDQVIVKLVLKKFEKFPHFGTEIAMAADNLLKLSELAHTGFMALVQYVYKKRADMPPTPNLKIKTLTTIISIMFDSARKVGECKPDRIGHMKTYGLRFLQFHESDKFYDGQIPATMLHASRIEPYFQFKEVGNFTAQQMFAGIIKCAVAQCIKEFAVELRRINNLESKDGRFTFQARLQNAMSQINESIVARSNTDLNQERHQMLKFEPQPKTTQFGRELTEVCWELIPGGRNLKREYLKKYMPVGLEAASDKELIFELFRRMFDQNSGFKRLITDPNEHGFDPERLEIAKLNATSDFRHYVGLFDLWRVDEELDLEHQRRFKGTFPSQKQTPENSQPATQTVELIQAQHFAEQTHEVSDLNTQDLAGLFTNEVLNEQTREPEETKGPGKQPDEKQKHFVQMPSHEEINEIVEAEKLKRDLFRLAIDEIQNLVQTTKDYVTGKSMRDKASQVNQTPVVEEAIANLRELIQTARDGVEKEKRRQEEQMKNDDTEMQPLSENVEKSTLLQKRAQFKAAQQKQLQEFAEKAKVVPGKRKRTIEHQKDDSDALVKRQRVEFDLERYQEPSSQPSETVERKRDAKRKETKPTEARTNAHSRTTKRERKGK